MFKYTSMGKIIWQNVQPIRHKSKITDSKLGKTKGMSAVKFKSANFIQDYWHKNEDKVNNFMDLGNTSIPLTTILCLTFRKPMYFKQAF